MSISGSKIWWFVGLWFLLLSAAHALTVATYNVENYLVADRLVDGVYRPAYPKPEAEKAAVQRVIRDLAPDVLALEEMGTPPFLDELQRDLRKQGADYPHAVVLEAADPDRHVAVLSKLPFKEVRRHNAVPVTFLGQRDVVKRGVLEVTFATEAGDVTLFVIHLKSRRTERPDDPEGNTQRLAEAEAVRDLVLTRFPEPAAAKFLVCGDWNDTRSSKPVKALARRGKTDLGEILRATDSRGETWTHFFRREDTYSRIDYLLVSAALKPLVAGDHATIHDGPGSLVGSDHRAVFVKLAVDPKR
ncbi:MAG: endonuclease/exonuclease/phosphatase family protein [Opitutae bacterium]|nr:endonuclease/exonuclease/phosphatase family protein [Opitutae bacterium]